MNRLRGFAQLRLILSLLGAIVGLILGAVASQSSVIAAIFAVVGFCGIWILARILYWVCSRRMKWTEHNIKYMEQLANQVQKQNKNGKEK